MAPPAIFAASPPQPDTPHEAELAEAPSADLETRAGQDAEASWFYAMPPVDESFAVDEGNAHIGGDGEQTAGAPAAQPAARPARHAHSRGDSRAAPRDAGAPLFILGNAPRASERLAVSLIRDARMAGTVEGRLLPLAQQLMRTTRQFYRVGLATAGTESMIRQIDASVVQRGIRRLFADALAGQFPEGTDWIDNTPGLAAIQSAMTMRMIWPKARFIFIASRMMESVASCTGEEAARPLSQLAANWTQEMQAWSDVRGKLGTTAITIDQLTLSTDPSRAVAAIAGLLSLDATMSAALINSLALDANPQPAPVIVPAADEDTIKGLAEPMMAAFGYGWGAYFRE